MTEGVAATVSTMAHLADVSPNEAHVYAAGIYENTVAIFSVDKHGHGIPAAIGNCPNDTYLNAEGCGGQFTRTFILLICE